MLRRGFAPDSDPVYFARGWQCECRRYASKE